MTTRNQNRAAAVAALYILDQAGALDGLTQQEITDALGLAHRSSVSRYLSDVARLRDLVPELLQAFRTAGEIERMYPP